MYTKQRKIIQNRRLQTNKKINQSIKKYNIFLGFFLGAVLEEYNNTCVKRIEKRNENQKDIQQKEYLYCNPVSIFLDWTRKDTCTMNSVDEYIQYSKRKKRRKKIEEMYVIKKE